MSTSDVAEILRESARCFIDGKLAVAQNRIVSLPGYPDDMPEDGLSLLWSIQLRTDIRKLLKRPRQFVEDLEKTPKCRSALIRELLVFGAEYISVNNDADVNINAIRTMVLGYKLGDSDEWENFIGVIGGKPNRLHSGGLFMPVIELINGVLPPPIPPTEAPAASDDKSKSSNVSLFSNIQRVKSGTYFRKEEPNTGSGYWALTRTRDRKYDTDFFSKITDPKALEIMRSILGGMAATEYIFKKYQFQVVNNSATCSVSKGWDPCWGPVKRGNNIELSCKCVNVSCPEFKNHRLFSNKYPTDDEIAQFNYLDKACIDEYGYENFRKKYKAFKVLANSDSGSEYDASETNKIQRHLGFKYAKELFGIEEPESKKPDVKPPSLTDDPVVHDSSSLGRILGSFKESNQSAIIERDPESFMVVDAGPGTGKTYSLIQKLDNMVTNLDVDPNSILALCFTNAAVDEIKSRLRRFARDGGDRGLVNIDVRTFHSFSWWLINQANEEGWDKVRLSDLTYDASISKATQIMNKHGNEVVGNWTHFIVDEVQDLTNERAAFVLAIIDACRRNGCGATVLGDFCQAIYNYSCKNSMFSVDSAAFYTKLYKSLASKAVFISLTENHRQTNALTGLTAKLRAAILTDNAETMQQQTQRFLDGVKRIDKSGGELSLVDLDTLRDGGNVCLLTRSNGDTYRLSSDLRKRGVPHTLNVVDNKDNYAAWIADVFCGYKKELIDYSAFSRLYTGTLPGNEAWETIQNAIHSSDEVLNVRELLNSISLSKIDDPLFRTQKSGTIIVSNIHKSKGREYDAVIFDLGFAESIAFPEKEIDNEEYRVLYVAATRAKKTLMSAPFSGRKGKKFWKIPIFASGRTRYGSTKNKKISFMEFGIDKGGDIDVYEFRYSSPEVLNSVSVGDEILLRKTYRNDRVDYKILLADSDMLIGYLGSSDYIDDINSYNRVRKDDYAEMPSEVSDLYVSGIHSKVMCSEDMARYRQVLDVSKTGVWKWVEFSGIGHVRYDTY